ncbi:MAG: flagellar hook-associated protein FlgK [Nitrospirae bacterium]|nr:flagellar hook-associated protein FlgK [Nitrospirota bacterium]
MSVLGLFDIGKTALLTTRRALDTTAHNVANASTPGYTRQDLILENIPTGTVTSIGMTGRGVRITEIKRMYDAFTTLQVRTEKSNLSYWDAYQKGILKIENIFNEASDTGISPAITDFFNAWQEVSQNPEGYAQRTLLIKKAEYLASRLNRAYVSVDDERTELYKSSQSLVDEVKSIASKIADLNEKIATSPGALDLKDQRDYLIERLNEIVKVSTFEDSVGRYSVLIGGTPIVDGGKIYEMSVSTDTENNMHFYVDLPDEIKEVTSYITGGELKANIDLRETETTSIMNRLNAFALELTLTTNQYHTSGYGLDNSTGNYFFTNISSPFTTKDSSTSGGSITDANVTISNLSQVNFEKQYQINYNTTGGTGYQQEGATGIYWRIQESTDGKTWTTIDPTKINIDTTVANTRTLQFSGINVKIDGAQATLLGTSPTFETFTVRPNTNAAMGMGVAITDPNKIAAAAGDLDTKFTITTGVNDTIIVNGNPVTLSNGSYNRFELANELQTQLNALLGAGAATVTFDAQTNKFKVTNNTVAGGTTISWTSQNTTAEDLFGFTSDADSVIPVSGYAESVNEIKGGSILIDSSNNTLRFSEDGGTTYTTVTIPRGTYTRSELAKVLKNALEGADTGTNYEYEVSYNPTTKKYTITNNDTTPPININPNSIILDWTNSTTTAESIFGFSSNSVIASGSSDASDFAVYPFLPGDNMNAKLIAALSGSGFINGSNPSDFYRSVVTGVGVEANSAKISQKFHNTMVEELERKRQETSGVNLDEEAANLIKYQKSFEAAAKMISVADELLSALINMTGR